MTNRLPRWLTQKVPSQNAWDFSDILVKKFNVNTVCHNALCPNRPTCFSEKHATFLILGDRCTRNCRFCAIQTSDPHPIDEDEPYRIAAACAELDIQYAVVTSVTRDDLIDGGAEHFAKTIRIIKERNPSIGIEVLIPDFGCSLKSLNKIIKEKPDVIAHNLETVKRFYILRNKADYRRSLAVLKGIKFLKPNQITKSSLMLGLGELDSEIEEVLGDLKKVNCDMLVLGQYLSPTKYHYPIQKFYTVEEFAYWKVAASDFGFKSVCSQPLARTSYLAKEQKDLCSM